ncbi:MAG: TIGR02449 family protein [Gammaproteobacteria bacterium]|nr:TIGR02449 family protein [Gammaproteobacteria bacterium]
MATHRSVDEVSGAFYILAMSGSSRHIELPPEFESFAASVESLVDLCARLREENAELRARCQQLQTERVHYQQVNARSREKLDATIHRLKALELEL